MPPTYLYLIMCGCWSTARLDWRECVSMSTANIQSSPMAACCIGGVDYKVIVPMHGSFQGGQPPVCPSHEAGPIASLWTNHLASARKTSASVCFRHLPILGVLKLACHSLLLLSHARSKPHGHALLLTTHAPAHIAAPQQTHQQAALAQVPHPSFIRCRTASSWVVLAHTPGLVSFVVLGLH